MASILANSTLVAGDLTTVKAALTSAGIALDAMTLPQLQKIYDTLSTTALNDEAKRNRAEAITRLGYETTVRQLMEWNQIAPNHAETAYQLTRAWAEYDRYSPYIAVDEPPIARP